MVGGGGGVPVAAQITITLAKYDFTSRYEQFLELLKCSYIQMACQITLIKASPQIKLPYVEGI